MLRHPFVLRPAFWRLGVLASLAVIAAGLLIRLLPLSLFGFVVLAVIAAALLGWRRLARGGPLPVLYIAQFRPETPGAEEASLNHQIAIRKRLATRSLISDELEIRALPAVIEQSEAERLLSVIDNVEGVVRGSVQAIADVGSFDAVLTFRSYKGPDRDLVLERQRGRNKVAYHHRVGTDYQVQLGQLVGSHFASVHADGIEGMVLVLLAEEAIGRGDIARAEICIDAAEEFREHLPDPGRTHLILARTFLVHREDLRKALKSLDSADREQRSLEVRLPAAWLAISGMNRKVIPPALAVREIRRAIELDPDSEAPHLWLADALVGNKKPDAALAELEWLKEHNILLEHDWEIAFRAGNIEYNRGNYEQAYDHYLDCTIFEPTARGYLYLADSCLKLGRIGAAKYNYREALLLEPELVDAHRGYWWGVEPGAETRSFLFDRAFHFVDRVPGIPKRTRIRMLYRLLLWHYRRHPEDSRVHFMLGAHALLLGDLDTAEERLLFANELLDGIDTEAIARLVLVALKKGDDGLAWKRLEELKAVRHGGPPSTEELIGRVVDLYSPIMDGAGVLSPSQGIRLAAMVEQMFPAPAAPAQTNV